MTDLILSLLFFIVFCGVVLVVFLTTSENKNYPTSQTSKRHSKNEVSVEYLRGAFLEGVETTVDKIGVKNKDVLIPSYSKFNVEYSVNLKSQTCTCPAFRKQVHFPNNDIRRWCKHLVGLMDKTGVLCRLPEEQLIPLLHTFDGINKIYKYKHPNLPLMYLVSGNNPEWLNVIARKQRPKEKVSQSSGEFVRYGWSFYGGRWSYGVSPPGASKIRPFLMILEDHDALEKFSYLNQ